MRTALSPYPWKRERKQVGIRLHMVIIGPKPVALKQAIHSYHQILESQRLYEYAVAQNDRFMKLAIQYALDEKTSKASTFICNPAEC